ncbi:type IV pilus biogenesis family protein [Massilia timonae]|uniref:Type IV pilus biogenesis family protein n=2 Tax=Massilia timonae TaxID=47229 RepID=A0A1S2NGM4_9BURK|nr:type IV pilus biogenesis family protein [Massilia timonae]
MAVNNMNKRLPLLLSLLALILLAASIAYWVLQLYKPEQRPLAAAPVATQPPPSPEAAATLFGGQPTAVISNFQLTGVVSAGADSAVILVADGQPPKAVRVGREIAPGVTVAEVHRRYVMLSDGGVMKRVELAPDTGQSTSIMPPEPRMQQQMPQAAAPAMEPQTAPGVVSVPPTMRSVPPPGGGPQGTPTTPENAQVVQEQQAPQDQQAPQEPQDPPPEQGDPTQQSRNNVQMPPNAPPMNQTQQPITQ